MFPPAQLGIYDRQTDGQTDRVHNEVKGTLLLSNGTFIL